MIKNLENLLADISNLDLGNTLYWVALTLGLVLAVTLILVIRRQVAKLRTGTQEEKDARYLVLIFVMALGINADAMYRALTQQVGLDWWFALPVFAFFELLQLFFMQRGTREYRVDGRVSWSVTTVVWTVAALASSITLMNSHNPVEAVVRVVLPFTVAVVWRLNLVTEVKDRKRGRVIYAVRQWLGDRGLLPPVEDVDSSEASKRYKVRRMMTLSYKIERGVRKSREDLGWLTTRRVERLRKMIVVSDQSLVEAAVGQLRVARYGLANLVPDLRLGQSQLEVEASRLVGQSKRSEDQSRPAVDGDQLVQLPSQSSDQSDGQLQLPVGRLGQSQSDEQSVDQLEIEDTDPDAVLMIQVQQLQRDLGRAPNITEVRRAISLEPGKQAGPERAKRIMRKMGLRDN